MEYSSDGLRIYLGMGSFLFPNLHFFVLFLLGTWPSLHSFHLTDSGAVKARPHPVGFQCLSWVYHRKYLVYHLYELKSIKRKMYALYYWLCDWKCVSFYFHSILCVICMLCEPDENMIVLFLKTDNSDMNDNYLMFAFICGFMFL